MDKLSIQNEMVCFDRKDREFYSSLTDEGRAGGAARRAAPGGDPGAGGPAGRLRFQPVRVAR